ncbi:MAG: hypothetical protein QRY74_02760 [Chlamydia sp.]
MSAKNFNEYIQDHSIKVDEQTIVIVICGTCMKKMDKEQSDEKKE